MGIMYALGSEPREGLDGLPVRGLGLPQDLDLVRGVHLCSVVLYECMCMYVDVYASTER